MSETYHNPVAQLLSLGDPRQEDSEASEWRDYSALGLSAEHIPELARMVLDDDLHQSGDENEGWAPLHAWRALGQLRAESAIEPLLQLLKRIDEEDDDWVQEDLPKVFGLIGPAAILGLGDLLGDADHGEWARITAGEALAKVVEQFPEYREQVVTIFTGQLHHFADQERIINAYLVSALCHLKAVESAAVIEQAFAANTVDLSVLGDWEEAQILLGLLEKRLTPAPNFFQIEFGMSPSYGALKRVEPPSPRKVGKQKKAKRKQVKASRKRNRKR